MSSAPLVATRVAALDRLVAIAQQFAAQRAVPAAHEIVVVLHARSGGDTLAVCRRAFEEMMVREDANAGEQPWLHAGSVTYLAPQSAFEVRWTSSVPFAPSDDARFADEARDLLELADDTPVTIARGARNLRVAAADADALQLAADAHLAALRARADEAKKRIAAPGSEKKLDMHAFAPDAHRVLVAAMKLAQARQQEVATPHVLLALLDDVRGALLVRDAGGSADALRLACARLLTTQVPPRRAGMTTTLSSELLAAGRYAQELAQADQVLATQKHLVEALVSAPTWVASLPIAPRWIS